MAHSTELASEKRPEVALTKENISTSDSNSEVESVYVEAPLTWKGHIWDTLDKPKAERWFLFKLDLFLLFTGCVGVFLRYLDQANVNNAFVSGMKEELSMYGNELNYANMLWSVGYVIGQLPSNIILTKVKPHYWLPFLEIMWSIITFCTARVNNMPTLYGLRFFLGFIESGHFPGILYITTSWYTKREVAKRAGIIQFCTAVGPMFSGYLQAAAYNGLDGVHGMSGWRWLFIIDGVISLPLALLALLCLPDVPRMQRPNWKFSAEEIALARRRVPVEAKIHVTYAWKDVISWFQTWHIYLFSIMFAMMCISGQVGQQMAFWFKSYNVAGQPLEYSVSHINVYPTGIQAIQIVSTVFYCYLSDNVLKGKRAPIIMAVFVFEFAVVLALVLVPVHPVNRSGRWALYYLLGFQGGTAALSWTWINESMLGEPVKRAFVSSFMNSFSYSFLAWTPVVMFPTYKQPFVTSGNIGVVVLIVFIVLFAGAIWYIQSLKRDRGFFRSVPPPVEEEDAKAEAEEPEGGLERINSPAL